MIVPGATFSANRLDITAGAAQAPNRISNGFGFMNDGSLAVDTDAPAGSLYNKGFRMSAAGAVYGTTSTAGSDVWIEGVRVSSIGQIVYEVAAATGVTSGNPFTSNGRLAVV